MLSNKCCLKKSGRTKRVLTIGTVTVVSLVVLSMVSSVIVFNAVFQRRDRNPYDLTMRYTPEDAAAYPRRSISFMSGENELKGYIYGEQNGKGLIIIANGFNAWAESHLGEVFYFVDAGWRVFTFEGTGVGESEGDSVVGLEQMRLDVLAVMDYVGADEELSNLPLFLYGHSAGGYAAASLCNDERVCAAVSISGFDSPVETMRFYAAKYVGVLADIEYPFLQLYDRYLFGGDSRINASSVLESAEHPVMIVQGSEDEIIPYELSIYAACRDGNNPNVRCVLIDDEYRGQHSTVWLDADAAKEFLELDGYKNDMLAQYGDELPDDVRETLESNKEKSDAILKNVDEAFLAGVSDFFADAMG